MTFPELYEDFSNAVPVPTCVRRDGALNIASHFPSNTVAPDLGDSTLILTIPFAIGVEKVNSLGKQRLCFVQPHHSSRTGRYRDVSCGMQDVRDSNSLRIRWRGRDFDEVLATVTGHWKSRQAAKVQCSAEAQRFHR